MSDVEEPPTKVTKLEELEWQQIEALDPDFTEEEEDVEGVGGAEALDEGQEEWLSEGAYTDDDNPVPDQENPDTNVNTSQELDDTLPSMVSEHLEDSQDIPDPAPTGIELKIEQHDIEETLNNLEGSKEDLPEDLDAFLIRKTDGVVVASKVKDEVTNLQNEDDGNDTDDLLRMLGEDDESTKKKVLKNMKVKKETKPEPSSDEDDDYDDAFVFEGVKVRTVTARPPLATRAEPEHSDADLDTDASSDEVATMKKMFGMVKKHNVASKSTTKLPNTQKKPLVKHVVQVNNGLKKKQNVITNIKSREQNKSILKGTPAKVDSKSFKKQTVSFKPSPNTKSDDKLTSKVMSVRSTEKNTSKFEKTNLKSEKTNSKPTENQLSKGKTTSKSEETASKFLAALKSEKFSGMDFEHDEMIDEEEFLDEDEFDLDEDEFGEESEMDIELGSKQRIMRPERMDEEVPTDEESHSEDGSLYDELPSSDSEDLDDWFTLDIRAERAGDYIPLLGMNASKLLTNEKHRMTERLSNLRESLTSLTESGRKQAEELKDATMALAELDDLLKAS